jgi:Ni,Fe-hydrogenase III small subunit
MKNWFLRGLATGIRTERLPGDGNVSPALSPGLPKTTEHPNEEQARALAAVCPTDAIHAVGITAEVDEDRCVLCMRCKGHDGQKWRRDVAWAHAANAISQGPLDSGFRRSLHVRVIDAGDCGSCLNELVQINGPSYNLHRLGIFITPTPRQADVLLVVGPATRQMRDALVAAYEAMPEPKRVIAVGVCAASGGVFGPSLMSAAGVAEIIPVDLVVPGCPPPPHAIIDALRLVCGQTKRTVHQ